MPSPGAIVTSPCSSGAHIPGREVGKEPFPVENAGLWMACAEASEMHSQFREGHPLGSGKEGRDFCWALKLCMCVCV